MENFANVGHVVHVFDIPQGIQNFFGPFGGQGVAGLDTERSHTSSIVICLGDGLG